MQEASIHDRKIIAISGSDHRRFLQGLITNDVERVADGLVYAALLTPQGKYLFDFFLFQRDETIMLDVSSGRAEQLQQRLGFYRLRQAVDISDTGIAVQCGIGEPPDGAFLDPRCAALGWRQYREAGKNGADLDWDALRVDHCIPESGIELLPETTYILEAGFERLNGVDFHKGCYVGQEVTARMKHKASRTKGLTTVQITGAAPFGTEILAGSRRVGRLFTQSGNRAIAHLRFDRLGHAPLTAGNAVICLEKTGADRAG